MFVTPSCNTELSVSIIQLRLDGTIEVMLPDSTLTVLKLERLTRLYDGLEQLEDMFGEEMSQSDDSYHEGEPEEVWAMDEHGMWMPEDAEDEDEWTDEEGIDSMDVDDEGGSIF